MAIRRPSGLRAIAPAPSKVRTSWPVAMSNATVGPAPPAYSRVPSGEKCTQPGGP